MKLMVIKIKSFQSNINQSIKQYLDELKPHLKDNINNLKKSDTWKIQLIVAINFISWGTCNAFKEYHIVIMTYDKADEVTKEHFESLLFRYQIGLEHQWKLVVLFLIASIWLHKKWSFLLRISLVIVTKSAESCLFEIFVVVVLNKWRQLKK